MCQSCLDRFRIYDIRRHHKTHVTVYVLGQVALKFFLEPLLAQREAIGKIVDFLIQHETRYSYPGTEPKNPMIQRSGTSVEEWRHQLEGTKYRARELASELIVRTHAVPLYTAFAWLGVVRSREAIRVAHGSLMTLSSSLLNVRVYGGTVNRLIAGSIREALKIEPEFRIEDEAAAESGDDTPTCSSLTVSG